MPQSVSILLVKAAEQRAVQVEHAGQPFTLEHAVRAYYTRADRPFDGVWLAVQAKWDTVKTPEGAGDWDWACKMARTSPLVFRPVRGEK